MKDKIIIFWEDTCYVAKVILRAKTGILTREINGFGNTYEEALKEVQVAVEKLNNTTK